MESLGKDVFILAVKNADLEGIISTCTANSQLRSWCNDVTWERIINEEFGDNILAFKPAGSTLAQYYVWLKSWASNASIANLKLARLFNFKPILQLYANMGLADGAERNKLFTRSFMFQHAVQPKKIEEHYPLIDFINDPRVSFHPFNKNELLVLNPAYLNVINMRVLNLLWDIYFRNNPETNVDLDTGKYQVTQAMRDHLGDIMLEFNIDLNNFTRTEVDLLNSKLLMRRNDYNQLERAQLEEFDDDLQAQSYKILYIEQLPYKEVHGYPLLYTKDESQQQ